MADTFTYDITTDVGRVRKLIQDTDLSVTFASSGSRAAATCFYTDEEIQDAINTTSSLRMAARELLLALTVNQYFLKNTTSLGRWGTDIGSALSALREHADKLVESDQDPYDVTAEMATTDYAYRDIIQNESDRGNL